MTLPRLPRFSAFILRTPWFWCATWLCWLATLWILSAGNPSINTGLHIPHFDKIAHFGYFCCGAGVLYAWLHTRQRPARPAIRYLITISAGTIIGALDEWHQYFTPGRMGLDPYDWLADLTGSITGTFLMAMVLHKVSSRLRINDITQSMSSRE